MSCIYLNFIRRNITSFHFISGCTNQFGIRVNIGAMFRIETKDGICRQCQCVRTWVGTFSVCRKIPACRDVSTCIKKYKPPGQCCFVCRKYNLNCAFRAVTKMPSARPLIKLPSNVLFFPQKRQDFWYLADFLPSVVKVLYIQRFYFRR